MNILKIGKISIDGTKIKANASKHQTLSWGYACKLEKQLKAEVERVGQQDGGSICGCVRANILAQAC